MVSPFVALQPPLFPQQAAHIWAHGRELSPCRNYLKVNKANSLFELLYSKNCLPEALAVVEGIHYHQQNLCALSYKDIKDTGLGITGS